MAVPVYQSISTAATGTGTSITTNAPSGVTNGDLLILCIATASAATVTTPSGWTADKTGPDSIGSFARSTILRRVADGTADDTPSVTISSSIDYVAFILRITGAAASPLDGSATQGATATSTGTVPSLGSLPGGELLVAMVAATNSGLTSDPTNWTQRGDNNAVGITCRIWTQTAASASSYGGESFTMAAGSYGSAAVSYLGGTATTFSRTFSENLAATTTPLRACTNLRTSSDNFGIKEGLFYKPKYKTFTHESLGFRDTPIVLPVWGRGVSETFGFRDPTITRTASYFRALSEPLGMTETINRSATLLRVVSELLALRDTIGDIQVLGPGGTEWHRNIVESLAMLDSMTRTTQYQRAIFESLAMTESILRRADCKRALSENMAFQEQIGRAVTALRSIAESLGMSDTALLNLITTSSAATSRRFYRPGALDYEWDRPAWVDQASEHRGTSDEQVQ